MHRIPLAALLMLGLSGLAMAEGCPEEMAEIDQALEDREIMSRLTPLEAQEAKTLRIQAEQHHENGDHDAAMRDLARARDTLGLD